MSNQINDIVIGTISGIKPYGIFVKLNDTFGFCHISNVSKNFIKNLNDLFKIGQSVKVKIIEIDENNKINLSMKEINQEPIIESPKTIQNHSKNESNINSFNNKKQSFDDMLNSFLKQSDDKLSSIDRRNKNIKKDKILGYHIYW